MSSGRHATSLTVLFVTSMHPSSAFPLRGVIVQRLAAGLRAAGHRVEFVELGVGAPSRYVLARRGVAQAILRVAPDVIHVHFGYSGLAVPRTPIPIVTTFNGDDLNGTVGQSGRLTLKSRVGILVSQYSAWRSARCITVSKALRERLWSRPLRGRTVVIRDAVDVTLFKPLPRETARLRLGFPGDAVLIIFPHAASQPTKRVWLAEAAVEALREWIPTARLWVVNGRPADDMAWYYAAADAMIVTSAREGGPTSVKEALACGLPVVSVAVGDTDLFAEVPAGILRAEASAGALASALRDALARAPQTRVNLLPAELSLPEAARAIETLYRQVIAEARAPETVQ